MKEKRVWIGLAVLFAVIGVPQLFWKPSRFGGIFLLALAIGCMGEWLMLCGREKHKACGILSRVGRVLFALFVLSFAAVQVFVIGIAFDEDDPSAAPQADYYLVLGALVNPNGQPSAALAARCDTAIAVLNVNPGSQAILCGGQGGDQGTRAIINNMYGGTFTDDAHTKYTADSAENIKAIQTLYDTDGINFDASIAGGDEITLFRNGTLQMAFCWNIAQQLNSDNNDAGLTNDGDEIMPMAFPTESGDPKLCGGIWGFGIFDNGDEAKVKAAKTFIEFIAADPDQVKNSVLASTYFPVRASVGDIYADNAIMSEYTKFMSYLGDYYQITPGWATARTEWWNMLQRVGTGEDVATAVATFVENANAAASAEA